jgi:hypothetical protein
MFEIFNVLGIDFRLKLKILFFFQKKMNNYIYAIILKIQSWTTSHLNF